MHGILYMSWMTGPTTVSVSYTACIVSLECRVYRIHHSNLWMTRSDFSETECRPGCIIVSGLTQGGEDLCFALQGHCKAQLDQERYRKGESVHPYPAMIHTCSLGGVLSTWYLPKIRWGVFVGRRTFERILEFEFPSKAFVKHSTKITIEI